MGANLVLSFELYALKTRIGNKKMQFGNIFFIKKVFYNKKKTVILST